MKGENGEIILTGETYKAKSSAENGIKSVMLKSSLRDRFECKATAKGETLSKIAQRYYGNLSLSMQLFDANKDILSNADLIKIGQELRIP